jgi:hypothetical protein
MYYRSSRIGQITSMSLASGGDRLSLHLGPQRRRQMSQRSGPD